MENSHAFRQPMGMATGIFLGFMLNFILGWVPDYFDASVTRCRNCSSRDCKHCFVNRGSIPHAAQRLSRRLSPGV